MAIQQTQQGLPYPDDDTRIQDMPEAVQQLAETLDSKVMGVYPNQVALNDAGPHSAGYLAWVTGSSTLQVYTGSSWVTVYPASPRIFSGSSAPASSLGSTGDVYLQF